MWLEMNKIILMTACVMVAVGAVLFLQVDNKPGPMNSAANEPAGTQPADSAQRPLVNRPLNDTDAAKDDQQAVSTADAMSQADIQPNRQSDLQADAGMDADEDTATAEPSYGEISAWVVNEEEPIEVDGVKGLAIQTDPAALQAIQVGKKIALPIPDIQPLPEATIESTHSPLAGINVFKGGLNEGAPNDNVIVTRGEIDTIFVVSTSTGVYTAIVNNKTGQGSLVNEADVNARAVPIVDGIEVAPIDMPLPERGQGS